jgi:multicomponent Na+:H+ antiporter subunit D
MQGSLITYTLLTPLLFAILSLLVQKWKKSQRILFVAGLLLYLIAAWSLFSGVLSNGILTFQAGGWSVPFGITLVADRLSSGLILLTSLLAFITGVYSMGGIRNEKLKPVFFPVLNFLIFGLTGSFLAGDIFNLYVWFEVMLVSSFVLFTLGGQKDQLEGSIKYVAINVLSSSLFLAGIGLVYGLTGSLNMAALHLKIPLVENQAMVAVAKVFFIISFGIKAAVFPLFFWLPATYHTPPVAISSLAVGLLTKVGIYVMIRFFTIVFPMETGITSDILLILSGFTMLVGVLGAAAQNDFRKILSFHIISQIGYMIMGLAIYTPLAIAGAIFFVAHNILVKTNLFLISGIVNESNGSYQLKDLGGVYQKFPIIALIFAISAFSLTGVPPLSGFWGKFVLVLAGFEARQFIIVGISLFVSILTLFSMTKIWGEVFWKNNPIPFRNESQSQFGFMRKNLLMVVPVIVLTLLILVLGFFPETFIDLSMKAAEQLLNPRDYVNGVFENQ